MKKKENAKEKPKQIKNKTKQIILKTNKDEKQNKTNLNDKK